MQVSKENCHASTAKFIAMGFVNIAAGDCGYASVPSTPKQSSPQKQANGHNFPGLRNARNVGLTALNSPRRILNSVAGLYGTEGLWVVCAQNVARVPEVPLTYVCTQRRLKIQDCSDLGHFAGWTKWHPTKVNASCVIRAYIIVDFCQTVHLVLQKLRPPA